MFIIGLLCALSYAQTDTKGHTRGDTWCEILYEFGEEVQVFPCQQDNIPERSMQTEECCPYDLWNAVTANGDRDLVTDSAAWKYLSEAYPHITDPEKMIWNGQKKYTVDSTRTCAQSDIAELTQEPPDAICAEEDGCMYFRWLMNNTILEGDADSAFNLFMENPNHPHMTWDAGKPAVVAIGPDGTVMLLKTYFTRVDGEATISGGTVEQGEDLDLCSYAKSDAVTNSNGWKVQCGLLAESASCASSCLTLVTEDNWNGAYCSAEQAVDVCSLPYDLQQGCDIENQRTLSATTQAPWVVFWVLVAFIFIGAPLWYYVWKSRAYEKHITAATGFAELEEI